MRTAVLSLLGIERDDRNGVVIQPVTGGVDRGVVDFDLRGVALDRDRVLLGIVVGNDVNSDAINPVVVDIPVLTRDPHPIDGAVVVHMLGDDILLGVDQCLELEGVAASATNENIVGDKLLIRTASRLYCLVAGAQGQ